MKTLAGCPVRVVNVDPLTLENLRASGIKLEVVDWVVVHER
jgi:hypothetical protein